MITNCNPLTQSIPPTILTNHDKPVKTEDRYFLRKAGSDRVDLIFADTVIHSGYSLKGMPHEENRTLGYYCDHKMRTVTILDPQRLLGGVSSEAFVDAFSNATFAVATAATYGSPLALFSVVLFQGMMRRETDNKAWHELIGAINAGFERVINTVCEHVSKVVSTGIAIKINQEIKAKSILAEIKWMEFLTTSNREYLQSAIAAADEAVSQIYSLDNEAQIRFFSIYAAVQTIRYNYHLIAADIENPTGELEIASGIARDTVDFLQKCPMPDPKPFFNYDDIIDLSDMFGPAGKPSGKPIVYPPQDPEKLRTQALLNTWLSIQSKTNNLVHAKPFHAFATPMRLQTIQNRYVSNRTVSKFNGRLFSSDEEVENYMKNDLKLNYYSNDSMSHPVEMLVMCDQPNEAVRFHIVEMGNDQIYLQIGEQFLEVVQTSTLFLGGYHQDQSHSIRKHSFPVSLIKIIDLGEGLAAFQTKGGLLKAVGDLLFVSNDFSIAAEHTFKVEPIGNKTRKLFYRNDPANNSSNCSIM